ncbi:MAG: hypothetical protein M3N91_07140 [Pseudomonadota bacterium]|nr:hypothetical protein [Pseudomonadota bacterium]
MADDPIEHVEHVEHVVVLMLENRSFDHILDTAVCLVNNNNIINNLYYILKALH